MANTAIADIVSFWREAGPEKWFEKDDDFDLTIRSRFLAIHEAAARGELAAFEETSEGALALADSTRPVSRATCSAAAPARSRPTRWRAPSQTEPLLAASIWRSMKPCGRSFICPSCIPSYWPIRIVACGCTRRSAIRSNRKFAVTHRDIILKFGRFPHRNRALGRETTPAEREFLDGGGFSG